MKTPKKPAPKTPAKAKKPAGRVFDVQRPGKAPATPTSRPVIVGHKPQVQSSVAQVSGVASREMLKPKPQKIEIFGLGEQGEAEEPTRLAPHRAPDLVPISQQSGDGAAPTPAKKSSIKIISPVQEPTPEKIAEAEAAAAPVKSPALPIKITRSDDDDEPAETTSKAPVTMSDVPPLPDNTRQAEPQPVPKAKPEKPIPKPAASTATLPPAKPTDDITPGAKSVPLPALQPRPFPAPRVPEVPIEKFVAQPLPDSYESESEPKADKPSAPSAAQSQPGPIDLPEEHVTADKDHRIIVSHHAGSATAWKVTLLLLIILLLAAVAINILLDGGVLDWPLPHTNYLPE